MAAHLPPGFETGSDAEMPPMGGDFDDESDAGMDMPSADAPLPEGIQKEIITEVEGFRRPKKGDEVSVHYVGTLASDGSEFDSSRSRGQPFVFTLGKGKVIKGWDLGVATMKKGELAKFTLAPEYAYGESGSPPKIPASATLVFEVELLSWQSKDDVFGDEGVIKSQLHEGSGYKSPKMGDEIKLSLKAVVADGSVVEEHAGTDYVLGSGTLGALGKAVDKALTGMKRKEQVSLRCAKDYAYGDKHPDGARLTLTCEEIYSTEDVSFAKDKSVMKKTIQQGEGFDKPKDGAKVTMRVVSATDGAAPLPGFAEATLEFPQGNGEVCDALECLGFEMKKGERAIVTCKGSWCAEAKLGLKDLKADKVVLDVEMVEFEKVKEAWDMSEEEKIEFATARKEVGTVLLKAGRYSLALERYKKVASMFSYCDNFKEENKSKAKALKSACDANKAMVFIKLELWVDAKAACEEVLKDDKLNVKAIYRRAQAQLKLKNFMECIADCKKVIELDPQNKDARALWKQAQAGQKEEDKKAKGLFANMCKALGKGPIPEPGKAAKAGDFSDEEEDAPMEDANAGEGKENSADAANKVSDVPMDANAGAGKEKSADAANKASE